MFYGGKKRKKRKKVYSQQELQPFIHSQGKKISQKEPPARWLTSGFWTKHTHEEHVTHKARYPQFLQQVFSPIFP